LELKGHAVTERRVLIVGESPNAGGDGKEPAQAQLFWALLKASTNCRKRDAFLLWWTQNRWAWKFDNRVLHVNLLRTHLATFSKVGGEVGALVLREVLRGNEEFLNERPDLAPLLGWRPQYVLLAGRAVAHACSKVFPEADDSAFLAWKRTVGPAEMVAVVPHPSRKSRVWNFSENRSRVLAFLEATARRL